ncbi:hypothetical protein OUZ56_012626 [Daphnia magna]|uniref:Uncharacterized protein n=1 Tax=Daphnia magna TaxID=35525 RepID=A0ABQ9Z3L1_9CRUS|nr:hypothetical protein OUZ56_012626 [Daphnia magna]
MKAPPTLRPYLKPTHLSISENRCFTNGILLFPHVRRFSKPLFIRKTPKLFLPYGNRRSARVAESLKQCSCSPVDVGQIEFNMGKPNEKGKNDVLSLKPSSLTEREEELSRGFHQYKKGDY